jgi:gliding motility-associated-like protein
MQKSILLKLLTFLLALALCADAGAQRMFFNSTSSVYEVQGTPGNFTYKDLGHFCAGDTNDIESIAAHGDTLYMLAPDLELFQVILSTGACKDLINLDVYAGLAGPNNLTCDNNGFLYFISENYLFRYDPRVNSLVTLGKTPVFSDGDLTFYNNMVVCAGNGTALWAIDPANPSNAYELMNTAPYGFYGLMALPDNCQKNRLFGIEGNPPGNIVEIDPLTWTLGNVVGQAPTTYVYDAASTIEGGAIGGVVFDSLALLSPCGNATSGSLQAFASSAADGGTSYTLDGTTTNTTGTFSNVAPGIHTIHIEAAPGCTVDSTFILDQGLSSVKYQIAVPEDCTHPTDGNIQITATSRALPILYKLNNDGLQPDPAFDRLDTGTYTLQVIDAGHCEKDTTISLAYQHIIPFPATLTAASALCTNANGSLVLALNSGIDPGSFAATLDGISVQAPLSFTKLRGGVDTLLITYGGGCRFDTVVTIPIQHDPEPAIQATVRNQLCFADNGNISLSITGMANPYLTSMSGGAFTAGSSFDGLAPASYTMSIRDGNGCLYDTSITIQPYPRNSVTLSIDTVDPVCTTLNSGSLTIAVQGDQAPYWLALGPSTYASGSTIGNLNRGDFILPVIDKDGCVVDSAHAHLDLDIEPECETVYLPNAFTPNGDGVNDVFRVLRSPYIGITGFRVFNRWGAMVFSGSDQHPGWDGTFHGELQPADTYVWEVSYIDLLNIARTAHGVVLLIR